MDTSTLLWGMVFGSIGYGYYRYGKKRAHPVARYSGIALIVYSYFIASPVVLVLVGVALMALPYFVRL